MNRARLVPGVALLTLGTLFLLDAVDVLEAGPTIAGWWPAAIIAFGAVRLLDRPPDRVGGVITAGIGLLLLGVTQDLVEGSVLTLLWPLGVIGVGVWLLATHRRTPDRGEEVDAVSAAVIFSGRDLLPRSERFTGGSVFAAFGGIDLDLRGCRPDPDGCHLDITVLFGGCDITVPPGWRVRMRGPAFFGGYKDHTDAQTVLADAPAIDVRVLAAFGGVEVKPAPVGAFLPAEQDQRPFSGRSESR